ncbi:hypothetical protein H6F43_10605 [Leptolyngbya sp. FACHB-36]|uniref:hypothetical protein n=1 Tax=Leptolyngbya sp. FACHB-36 TaxID=2692808 RepID=UPI001680DE84|nr:hypothetical protein [Leptolyngbya sp. FACHB-36]MBD2020632.1 hypothetical protein [Leptolyngbya sp. FACHB-36]
MRGRGVMVSRFRLFVGDLALDDGLFHRLRCLVSHSLSDVVWQFLVVWRWVTPDLGIVLAA